MFTKVVYNLCVAIAADLHIAHLLGRQEKRGMVSVCLLERNIYSIRIVERIHHLHFDEPNNVLRMNGWLAISMQEARYIFVIRSPNDATCVTIENDETVTAWNLLIYLVLLHRNADTYSVPRRIFMLFVRSFCVAFGTVGGGIGRLNKSKIMVHVHRPSSNVRGITVQISEPACPMMGECRCGVTQTRIKCSAIQIFHAP